MKIIAPAALAALDKGEAIVSGAVEIGCVPPLRIWGGWSNLTFDGRTFEPVGDRSLVQVAGGALGDAAQNISLSLSGIDAETLALLDASEVARAPTILWRLIFSSDGNTLLDYHVWSRGTLDQLLREEEVGGTATITTQLETPARGLGRRGGRMRSDADQRLVDPNDGFFKHTAFAGEKTLYWGGRRPANATSALGGQTGNVGGGGGAADQWMRVQ